MSSRNFLPRVASLFGALVLLALGAPSVASLEDAAAPAGSWNAPPYWTPAPETHGRRALAAGPTALPFIALPPCRIIDTRAPLFPAPLGGGFLPPATVRSYTVTGICGLPANAQAVSLNATVVHPTGPGFLTLWPQGGTFPPVSTLNYLGNDVIVNAAVVPLSGSGGISMALGVSGGDVVLDTNGYYASVPTVSSLNTLTGDLTLQGSGLASVTSGSGTVTISVPLGVTSIFGTNGVSVSQAQGAVTVTSNATSESVGTTIVARDSSGDFKARTIQLAGDLWLPDTGSVGGSLFLGSQRFLHNYGDRNVFLGRGAGNITLTTGSLNVGIGWQSLNALTTGSSNAALGTNSLDKIATGSYNAALGYLAGTNLTLGSNNVYIANPGLSAEVNTIRIGSGSGGITPQHFSFFVAAVRGVTTGIANAVPVLIDSNGQLGTTSSSIRFKDDVRDMGDESAKLMQLRPVTFRYKAHGPDGPKQYGLIAEEVDAVMPELVARSKDGEIETVMYHELPAILLNEIQRLEKRVAELEKRFAAAPQPQDR